MRVLFVITSLGAGGTERSTAQLLPELRRRGVDVHVATLKRAPEGDEESVRAQGFPVTAVPARSLPGRIAELRRLIRRLRPDVVHTAIFDADLAGRLAAWHTGTTVVSSLVNTSYDPARLADPKVSAWRLRVVQDVDGWTARHLVHRLHAVSQGVADANIVALRLRPDRVEVVERGRDWEEFGAVTAGRRAAVRAGLGVGEKAPVLLSVGRIEFQKAHVDLVASAERLLEDHPDLVVLVAGRDGNASTALHTRLATSPARECVRLLGHRTDIPDLLAAADVFVLPSVYEGTAGAAIEAMAMGVPIVATDVAGVRGILENGRNSLLVPAGAPAELAGAIRRLLDQPELRVKLVGAGRDDTAGRFTIAGSAERLLELYERARETAHG